jgi:hypothetical protein
LASVALPAAAPKAAMPALFDDEAQAAWDGFPRRLSQLDIMFIIGQTKYVRSELDEGQTTVLA